MHYIVVMRDDYYYAIGPFDSHESAGDWGYDPKNNPADDPRWQTIYLTDPTAPPEVRRPFERMDE
jgi:hypothetical protein